MTSPEVARESSEICAPPAGAPLAVQFDNASRPGGALAQLGTGWSACSASDVVVCRARAVLFPRREGWGGYCYVSSHVCPPSPYPVPPSEFFFSPSSSSRCGFSEHEQQYLGGWNVRCCSPSGLAARGKVMAPSSSQKRVLQQSVQPKSAARLPRASLWDAQLRSEWAQRSASYSTEASQQSISGKMTFNYFFLIMNDGLLRVM